MPYGEGIARRTVGAFPLSIATSLAIESACGVHPDIRVAKAPILSYTELWINMRTLFRNFMGSLDPTTHKGVVPEHIGPALVEEMGHISDIIAEQSKGKAKVVYYLSNYAGMEQKYRHAVLRKDNTPKQKEFSMILRLTLGHLMKDLAPNQVQGFELKLHTLHQPQAMLLTHIPYDLVAWKEFRKLVLLESHTGAVKERAQWSTKYVNGKDLSQIPFREDMLQIFGDKETFHPMDGKLRQAILEIAAKYRWSSVTGTDMIKYGIDQLPNPYHQAIVRDIIVR
jgi:hypothetical protein